MAKLMSAYRQLSLNNSLKSPKMIIARAFLCKLKPYSTRWKIRARL
jgi:hypothetical protein